MAGKRGSGRPNMTWKRQVEEHVDEIELKKEDAIDKTKSVMVFTNFQET